MFPLILLWCRQSFQCNRFWFKSRMILCMNCVKTGISLGISLQLFVKTRMTTQTDKWWSFRIVYGQYWIKGISYYFRTVQKELVLFCLKENCTQKLNYFKVNIKRNEETIFKRIFRMLRFYKNPWISLYCKFCLWTPWCIFAVSTDVSRVCDVVYEEERSWSGVNQTVLKIYGAKPYQFEPTYPLREEPAQKEERSASILRHKFQKHPLTPQFCAAVLGPTFAHKMFFLITTRNKRKIDLLKDRSFFWVQFSLMGLVRMPFTKSTNLWTKRWC